MKYKSVTVGDIHFRCTLLYSGKFDVTSD